jgi:hypothetical protein
VDSERGLARSNDAADGVTARQENAAMINLSRQSVRRIEIRLSNKFAAAGWAGA